MINLLVWIIIGAVVGWIASLVMRTYSRQGLLADIIVGMRAPGRTPRITI